MNKKQIRKLALVLLDDGNGISEAAFAELAALLIETNNGDVVDAALRANDRFFLDEDVAETLRLGN